MSGTPEARDRSDVDPVALAEVLRSTISRDRPVLVIDSLRAAIGASESRDFSSLTTSAVCLDTNILFKAVSSSKLDDLIDYFRTRHAGPLIVSGQSLQEFWNNYHSALETIAKGVENKIVELEKALSPLDGAFSDYKAKLLDVLEDFKEDNEHLFSKDLKRHVVAFLEVLREKGLEVEAPRPMFHEIAVSRKATKTPPGFKDGGDGDFFVWLDFLYGLLIAKQDKKTAGYNKAILVTADRKKDWVKGSAAHPVLVAEVQGLVHVPFEIWSLTDLLKGISDSPPSVATSNADAIATPAGVG